MKRKPLFSVVIPVYKCEKYLEKCVNSILDQDTSNFEIIIVDDGSPDKCPELCDNLQKNNNQIKVIHKKNGGVSAARRDGIEEACGEYIVCIDADDWIGKGCFTKATNIVQKYNPDLICYETILVDGKYVMLPACIDRKGFYTNRDIQKYIFPILIHSPKVKYFTPSLCGKFIKRELLLDNMLVNKKATIGEDGACVIPCVFHAKSMYMMKEYFYYYRYNRNSATKGRNVFFWECPKIVNVHIAKHIDMSYGDLKEQLNRKITHDFFNTAVTQFYQNKTYYAICKEIKEHFNDVYYKKAIKECKFKMNYRTILMLLILKYRIYGAIYLYAKIK